MADETNDVSYRDAMRGLIAQRFGAVWKAAPVALAGDDIAGVHDVRVASRRLRAAMDIAERAAAPESESPGLDRLIQRVEAERDVAREAMTAFLNSIKQEGVAEAAAKRFGPSAGTPKEAEVEA